MQNLLNGFSIPAGAKDYAFKNLNNTLTNTGEALMISDDSSIIDIKSKFETENPRRQSSKKSLLNSTKFVARDDLTDENITELRKELSKTTNRSSSQFFDRNSYTAEPPLILNNDQTKPGLQDSKTTRTISRKSELGSKSRSKGSKNDTSVNGSIIVSEDQSEDQESIDR